MKKLKKQIPALLYAFLLLTIAALGIAIVDSKPLSADANDKSAPVVVDKNDTENTSKETINDQKQPSAPDESQPTPERTVSYDGTVPRRAEASDIYLYTQKIYGNGKTELCDVFQTSVGIYVLVKTDSTDGDVCGKSPCVGIIKTDSYGNIVKSLSLDFTYAGEYVTSCPTALGLVVVTSPSDKSYYYVSVIPYELETAPAYRISAAESGKIVPTANSFLFFAEYADESLLYSYENGSFSFQSVGKGKITDVFEYGAHYVVVSSDTRDNSYSISILAKNGLGVLSETLYSGGTALKVFPVPSESGQAFIVIENRNGSIWAKKFSDSSFSTVLSVKKIGNFELRGAYFDGENILLVCKGNLNGIIVLAPELDTKFNECGANFIPSDITDGLLSSGTLYYLATDDSGKLALLYAKDEQTNIRYFDLLSDKARIIINLDGTFALFCQNDNDVIIVGFEK